MQDSDGPPDESATVPPNVNGEDGQKNQPNYVGMANADLILQRLEKMHADNVHKFDTIMDENKQLHERIDDLQDDLTTHKRTVENEFHKFTQRSVQYIHDQLKQLEACKSQSDSDKTPSEEKSQTVADIPVRNQSEHPEIISTSAENLIDGQNMSNNAKSTGHMPDELKQNSQTNSRPIDRSVSAPELLLSRSKASASAPTQNLNGIFPEIASPKHGEHHDFSPSHRLPN